MCITYLFFIKALKAQGWDRKDLPYVGWAQPFCAYFGLTTMSLTVIFYGYTTFLNGWWDTGTFFSYYLMVGLCPLLYVSWKIIKKTKIVKAEEAGMSPDFSFRNTFQTSWCNILTQNTRSHLGETNH